MTHLNTVLWRPNTPHLVTVAGVNGSSRQRWWRNPDGTITARYTDAELVFCCALMLELNAIPYEPLTEWPNLWESNDGETV